MTSTPTKLVTGPVPVVGDPTFRVGLVGWPVEHSVSPAMHNAAFDALDLNWRYFPLPTPLDKVEVTLAQLREHGYRGANITLPHKRAVMPYLDELTDAARAIGAVNTIFADGARLVGHNTDGDGFLVALREAGFIRGQRVLVLGAGGGARAVVYALAELVVRLPSTTGQRGGLQVLCRTCRARASTSRPWLMQAAGLQDLDLDAYSLLVNTTPVGMWPNVEASPWPEALPCRRIGRSMTWSITLRTHACYPGPVLRRRPVGGLGMLVHQGALAFDLDRAGAAGGSHVPQAPGRALDVRGRTPSIQ